ncbi:hypothetical protein [Pandoraea anhela]|uniref:Uncharacterized protein n=1 Tax=Pandoraea anhela TaxID=2508295 RepID=A0A5E4WLD3_9BURK|nr:hypothetical protein [Pandoraea anhela]VVE23845.1 hypothetical protein PAN31108_03273 [Pandoraea anhela]
MSSPSSGGTTTTKTELPDWAQPYAQQLLQRGADLSNQPVPQYDGQVVAGMNGTQTGAISGLTGAAANQAGTAAAASNIAQQLAGGSAYQTKNPYTGNVTASTAASAYADPANNPYLAATVAQQKLAQEAQQKAFDNRIALGKLGVEQYNAVNAPVVVPPGNSVISKAGAPIVQGTPQVARTIETQDGAGNTYTLQYGGDGRMIGEPVLKSAVGVGPLSEAQQKTVNDAAAAAADARTTYQNTTYLANQLASAPEFASGAAANFNDMLTRITGNKDAGQQLRGQLAQFVNKSILSELPPGSASDKDIALVRNGVPADNAAPNTWLAYLQAVGRVQKGVAEYQAAKADYSAANRGSLGPLSRDATINGIQFPAGTTFAQATLQQQPAQQGQAGQPQIGRYSLGDINSELKRRGLMR